VELSIRSGSSGNSKIIIKNYGNSNISPCPKYNNLSKNPLKETKILQDIITL